MVSSAGCNVSLERAGSGIRAIASWRRARAIQEFRKVKYALVRREVALVYGEKFGMGSKEVERRNVVNSLMGSLSSQAVSCDLPTTV